MPELRPARKEDVALVARVLELAGRGHLPRGPWDVMLPDERERDAALRELAGGPSSWCHYSVFDVAEHRGEAGAALCAFEPRALGGTGLGAPLAAAFERLGWPLARLAAAAAPLAPYQRCFPPMPDGSWIVENVGTLPQHRRRGLVGALLERALEAGRRGGFARAQISCLVENEPALRAYERAGFAVVETREDPEFEKLLGARGFVRMTQAL
jgi:ribosomal protein S18 acetylase RimI-like enzyme